MQAFHKRGALAKHRKQELAGYCCLNLFYMIGYDEIRYDRYACLNFLTLLGCLTHMILIWVHEETQGFTVHHERSKCRRVCRQAYQFQDTKIGRIRTHRHITLYQRKMNSDEFSVLCMEATQNP